VLEVLTGTKTVSEACRAYNIKYESLNRWRNHFLENADQLFQTEGQTNAEEARIAELERVIGRLTLELEIAKKASSLLSAHLQRSGR
jgi:transposase